MNKIENAEAQVNYCLQQAYKIAVRVAGITDWSKTDDRLRDKHVELLQVEIAKMLNDNLNNIPIDGYTYAIPRGSDWMKFFNNKRGSEEK